MLYGKYVIEIACDEQDCKGRRNQRYAVEYIGVDAAECTRKARQDRWILHRDGRCTCPVCSGREKRR